MSDPDFGSAPFFIKKEGVYMFGGVHGIDSSEKNLTDKIYYLPVGQQGNIKWRELETYGQPPKARFYHD